MRIRLKHVLDRMPGPTEDDGTLLERFVRHRDQAAFAALVERHGRMVFGVCRRVLGNSHDAEDAFQATFFVLARRPQAVRPRSCVGNFLSGVAFRTAMAARRQIARRRQQEAGVAPRVLQEEHHDDLRRVLDEELARLPDKYREVIVLCDLEGRSRREVAGHLRCPEGTVASRLNRARTLLAGRLTRRGITLSAIAVAEALFQAAAEAALPRSVRWTVKAVLAGSVSVNVLTLTEGALKMLLWEKLKSVLAVLLVVGVLGSGAGWLYFQRAHAADGNPAGPAVQQASVQQEIGLLKQELQKALERVNVLEARLTVPARRAGEVLYQGKPASFWVKQLEDRDPEYRAKAVWALGGISEVDKSVVPVLVTTLKDTALQVRSAVIGNVASAGKEALPLLAEALKEKDHPHRTEVLMALDQFGREAKPAVPLLIASLRSSNRLERVVAARTLGGIGPEAKAAVPALAGLLKDPAGGEWSVAIEALGKIGPDAKDAVPALVKLLPERRAQISLVGANEKTSFIPAWTATEALGKIGPAAKEALPALRDLARYEGDNGWAKEATAVAIQKIEQGGPMP